MKPGEVLVVDEKERIRYNIVRFFFTLMGSYHSQGAAGPDLRIGLAEFARTYRLLFPLTDTSHLFEAGDWDSLYNKLSQGAFDLASLNACHTNFAHALRQAADELRESGAQNRILVLISDGSFRGLETGKFTQVQHAAAHQSTREVLEDIATEYHVKTYVVLLGTDRCFEERDCGLAEDNWLLRQGDIEAWRAWENTWLPEGNRLVETLIEENPFQDLALEFEQLLPPAETANWVSQSDGRLYIPRYICSAAVMAVAVHSVGNHDVQLLDAKGNIVVPASPEPRATENVFRWYITQIVRPIDSCGVDTWTLDTNGNEMYYWSRQDLPPFRITDLKTVPEPPIIMNSPEITVEVNVGGATHDDFNYCHQMELALLAEEKEITSTIQPVAEHISQRLVFEPMSPQTLTLRAHVQLSDDPEKVLVEQEMSVWAEYEAELVAEEVSSWFSSGSPSTMGPGDTVTISFPIRYGSPEYVPGFSPVFSLTSEIVEDGRALPSGCKDSGPQGFSLQYDDPALGTEEGVLVYSVVVSFTNHWEEECKYRYVDVGWTGTSSRYDISDSPPRLIPSPDKTISPLMPAWFKVILVLLCLSVLIVVAVMLFAKRS
jgi:hypothetical protein